MCLPHVLNEMFNWFNWLFCQCEYFAVFLKHRFMFATVVVWSFSCFNWWPLNFALWIMTWALSFSLAFCASALFCCFCACSFPLPPPSDLWGRYKSCISYASSVWLVERVEFYVFYILCFKKGHNNGGVGGAKRDCVSIELHPYNMNFSIRWLLHFKLIYFNNFYNQLGEKQKTRNTNWWNINVL